MRRGQVWSIDLVIAVLIFLLAIGVFYFLNSSRASNDQSTLRIDSQVVADKLTGTDALSVVDQGAVQEQKLLNLSAMDYDALKDQLGVRNDFCIVLVDKDGNLILLGNGTESRVGVGQPNLTINVSGTPYGCGAVYTGT